MFLFLTKAAKSFYQRTLRWTKMEKPKISCRLINPLLVSVFLPRKVRELFEAVFTLPSAGFTEYDQQSIKYTLIYLLKE